MTVYLAAAHFGDVNPLNENGVPGAASGDMRTGDIIPSTYPDRNGLRFAVDSPGPFGPNEYYDFLTSETPVPIDTTPKWVHVWWDLSIYSRYADSGTTSDAFALYCSDGRRLLNFANLLGGVYLRVYDNTGAVVFSDYTTDYPGRSEYGTNEINIKITGGSLGNVTVFEGTSEIANVDVPNINTDIARIRLGQPDTYGLTSYFQELLIADFDTRGARVKNINLSAATTNTAGAETIEANARTYFGNHNTYNSRDAIIFDTDGQQIVYPADGLYQKDLETTIMEVRLRTFGQAISGTPVPNIIPFLIVEDFKYIQPTISPAPKAAGATDPIVLVNSPASASPWTETEINGMLIGLEAEI